MCITVIEMLCRWDKGNNRNTTVHNCISMWIYVSKYEANMQAHFSRNSMLGSFMFM